MRHCLFGLALLGILSFSTRAEEPLTDKQLELLCNDSIGIIGLPSNAWPPAAKIATDKLIALPKTEAERLKKAFIAAWKDISPLAMLPNQKEALEQETRLKWNAWQTMVDHSEPSPVSVPVSVTLTLNADGSGSVLEKVNISAFLKKTRPEEEAGDNRPGEFEAEVKKAFDAHWGLRTFNIAAVAKGLERVKAELKEVQPGLWAVESEVKFKTLDGLNQLGRKYGNPLMAWYSYEPRTDNPKRGLFKFSADASDLEEWEFIQKVFSDWKVSFSLKVSGLEVSRTTGTGLPDGVNWQGALPALMFSNAVLAELNEPGAVPQEKPRPNPYVESTLPEPPIEDPNADPSAVNETQLKFAQSLLKDPNPLKRYRGLKYLIPVEDYMPHTKPKPLALKGISKALHPQAMELLDDQDLFLQYAAYAVLKRYLMDMDKAPEYYELQKWKALKEWNVEKAPEQPAPAPVPAPESEKK